MRTITLYTTPNCFQCGLTKKWLDRAGAEYTTVDLSISPDDLAAMKMLNHFQAPVIVISNGDPETDIHWSGFQPDHLHKYVGSAAA